MKVALVQTYLHWENRSENLKHFSELLDTLSEPADLIVLPEMFTTGFSMNPKKTAEPANGETLKWLQTKAKEKNAILCGSVAVKDRENYFNRLFWVEPNGEFKTYNKRHLFRMGQEDQFYKAGAKKLITSSGIWKFCPLICYDLRFPVWSRNRFKVKKPAVEGQQSAEGTWDYDVLLYVANWPKVRIQAWRQLLIARAIENQCYVIGVNRTGKDGNGHEYSGDSLVINPKGEIMSKILPDVNGIDLVDLDKASLDAFRLSFPVSLDADDFTV